jgi:general L-amino acid transport system permease protein
VTIRVGFVPVPLPFALTWLSVPRNRARAAAQDPSWLGFHAEAYAFAAMLYFAGSAALSRYGLWLERRVGAGRKGELVSLAVGRAE